MAECYADPYCLESQNLGTAHFPIHVVVAEGLIGFKGWLLGSEETSWEGGNVATLLIDTTYSVLHNFDLCIFFWRNPCAIFSVPCQPCPTQPESNLELGFEQDVIW